MSEVPAGFAPLDTDSPFNTLVGPYYTAARDGGLVLGLRVEQKHCNSRGRLHGSMVCAMADIAIGHNVGLALAGANPEAVHGAPKAPIATVSLNTDFVSTAHVGDWVETRVDVQKGGRSLAFANAYLFCGDERIARTSAVFKIFQPR